VLRRRLGRSTVAPRLPREEHLTAALAEADYDEPEWDADPATPGFRNVIEGWPDLPGWRRPNLHNRVHVWVGGDMSPATSPNDPVFFLNHCFVDRAWAAWQARPGDRGYRPPDTAPAELFRHRPADPLFSVFRRDAAGTPWLVRDMFDVSAVYTYDSLD
jgi:tyrosinase